MPDDGDLMLVPLDVETGKKKYQIIGDDEGTPTYEIQSNCYNRTKLKFERFLKQHIWKSFCFILILFIILIVLIYVIVHSRQRHSHDSYPSQSQSSGPTINSFYASSTKAAVASDVGVCSDMGISILRMGGNAIDAAVSVTLCLGVYSPASSGIGGGSYIVYYDAINKQSIFIDSREMAPNASTPTMFEHDPLAAQYGGLAIGIFSELKGLYYAYDHYGSGKVTWKELVQPVANIAENVVITPETAELMKNIETQLKTGKYTELSSILLDSKGNVKKSGDIMIRSKFAYTLSQIAEYGPDYLYQTMSSTLAQEIQDVGGIITQEDIEQYTIHISEPIQTKIYGYTYLGASGSSSGSVAVASILKYMSGYTTPLVSQGYIYYHYLIEAMKHIFAIRMSLADPLFVNTTGPISAMLDTEYLSILRSEISDITVLPSLQMYGGEYNISANTMPPIDHGTTHLSIIDEQGNAVALTSTINTYFGSLIMSPSTGIIFNNQMDDFSISNASNYFNLAPNKNNYPYPGKRPLSSMSPSIVIDDQNRVRYVGGGSGGPKILTGTAQVLLNLIGRGMDVLSAVIAPRVHTQLLPDSVCIESNTYVSDVSIIMPMEIQTSLLNRGHNLTGCYTFGVTQFIAVNPDTGLIEAVSDPRKDGRPAGL